MQLDEHEHGGRKQHSKNATFGQRRRDQSDSQPRLKSQREEYIDSARDFSYIPSGSGRDDEGGRRNERKRGNADRGVEKFGGTTMQRGRDRDEDEGGTLAESERHGRTKRRSGVRSGSRNTFRRM